MGNSRRSLGDTRYSSVDSPQEPWGDADQPSWIRFGPYPDPLLSAPGRAARVCGMVCVVTVCSMSRVRRVRPDEGPALREIRLNALRCDPQAFGSTYEAEEGVPSADWSRLAAVSSEGSSRFIAVAELDGRLVGIAGGYQPDESPDERGIWGMWVVPEARRLGIGRDLVRAVRGWSKHSGAVRLILWVVETNEPAVALYRSMGFTETGETQLLPSDETLVEIQLALQLTFDA